MSFLPKAADDDPAALRELFEVVDEWTNSVAASGPVASLSKDASRQKRKRDPAVDVRRRLKKKAERTKLRQHVQELQHQLARLRRQPSRDNLDDNCVESEPQHHTDIETRTVSPDIRALADAEALNEGLRGELAKSSAMLRALEESISVMTGDCECAFQLTKSKGVDASTVEKMYADLQQICAKIPTVSPESLLYTSNTNIGADGLPRVELMTGVHLGCGINDVRRLLVAGCTRLGPFGRLVRSCLETEGSTSQQGYSLDMPKPYAPQLLSTGILQKHEQNDGIVLLWTCKLFHPSELLSFLGQAWIIVTTSPLATSQSPMTLMRSFYDLSAQRLESPGPSIAEANLVRSFLIGAMGERVRHKHKLFLQAILTVTGREDLAVAVVA